MITFLLAAGILEFFDNLFVPTIKDLGPSKYEICEKYTDAAAITILELDLAKKKAEDCFNKNNMKYGGKELNFVCFGYVEVYLFWAESEENFREAVKTHCIDL